MNRYPFPMAANTATMVLYNPQNQKILLGKRSINADAFPGKWSLPGGFLDAGQERMLNVARRETLEEVSIDIPENRWSIFYVDDRPGADPRYAQIINLCYYAYVEIHEANAVKAADDLDDVEWFDIDEVLTMKLAFDHLTIVKKFAKMFPID
jgi:ADP-ribose pyrophosphatase YjhB (NUDIX family)